MAFTISMKLEPPHPALDQGRRHAARALASGRASSCGETLNHTEVSKGILKELIERQQNRDAHLQLLHL